MAKKEQKMCQYKFEFGGTHKEVCEHKQIRIQDEAKSRFLIKKFYIKMQYFYTQASMKGFQSPEKNFSQPKRTSSTSKHEIYSLFCGCFALLDSQSGSGFTDPTDSRPNPDLDPNH
jgi:hypothetical protein